jgi:ABC-type bacteriocin/lantibiotic exporter with double-glycine peptidase domain
MFSLGKTKPLAIGKTGDDRPAASVFRYIFRMSGYHQVLVCLLAVLIAPLSLAPIELQRRIVNDIVGPKDVDYLFLLGGIFLGVLVIHQALKFLLKMYQTWIAESTVVYTRNHLLDNYERANKGPEQSGTGNAVTVLVRETDNLGTFVGTGLSQAAANITTLVGIVGYMFVIEPRIAAASLSIFIPQIIITYLAQQKMNNIFEKRLRYLRSLGQAITSIGMSGEWSKRPLMRTIYRNRIRFSAIKFGLKAIRNFLTTLPTIVALVFGGYLAINGQVEIGTIVAFVSSFERIASPVRELLAFYSTAAQAEVQHGMIAKWLGKHYRNRRSALVPTDPNTAIVH